MNETELFDAFVKLRETLLRDCNESQLPRIVLAAALQGLSFELQQAALNRDPRPGGAKSR